MLLDQETIKAIAEEIASKLDYSGVWFLVLTFLIALIASALGSYLGAYFRESGKIAATSAQFTEILREQRATVAGTEEIKNEIANEFGRRNSIRALYREKLEEVLQTIDRIDNWLDEERRGALADGNVNFRKDPIIHLHMLHELYFPLCLHEYQQVVLTAGNVKQWIIQLAGLRLQNPAGIEAHVRTFGDLNTPFTNAIWAYRNAVVATYHALAEIRVPPQAPP